MLGKGRVTPLVRAVIDIVENAYLHLSGRIASASLTITKRGLLPPRETTVRVGWQGLVMAGQASNWLRASIAWITFR